MSDLPLAQVLEEAGVWQAPAADRVVLDYEARFLRRKRLVTEAGMAFVVDLEQTTSLDAGDALLLADGRRIEVAAATEEVLEVRGPSLPQLAWHIGNRHTPCQIADGMLLIRRDPVIRHMLEHLGAEVTEAMHPFTPEGGAYGHGRTHSHEHGHTAHAH
ncbi:urease accessory protein UreE [uncultured Mameliella sp.]|uniref:urease accessory protein UreE n=1 Tax=uncultured Mameliella sp. TaxID=1447087 RepID=UPI00261ABF45|nr:urease accessory protein UreE [uncultured Mameliella sp.]